RPRTGRRRTGCPPSSSTATTSWWYATRPRGRWTAPVPAAARPSWRRAPTGTSATAAPTRAPTGRPRRYASGWPAIRWRWPATGGTITYREAVAEGIAREMRRDPTVVCLGEDIGAAEGVFKTTVGLFKEFGPRRVWDTPISEQAIVGAAMGAAMTGIRPVAE